MVQPNAQAHAQPSPLPNSSSTESWISYLETELLTRQTTNADLHVQLSRALSTIHTITANESIREAYIFDLQITLDEKDAELKRGDTTVARLEEDLEVWRSEVVRMRETRGGLERKVEEAEQEAARLRMVLRRVSMEREREAKARRELEQFEALAVKLLSGEEIL